MDLPKNVTQIGEADQRCKVYVEDYVVSYLKQLNAIAVDKELAVAMYGVRKVEGEITYLFLYGACKVNFLQKESRHLSQAQQQEIERCRKKYFRDYTFLAYRLLNGEMIEGFHVCEQGICRYISGYSQFYEKNDSMLAYMLDVRQEAEPETVEQEKYDVVKKRQEERRSLHEEQVKEQKVVKGRFRKMRGAAVAVFAMLCVIGLASMNNEADLSQLKESAKRMLEGIMQQQIPDTVEVMSNEVEIDTIVAEDKLTDALLQENAEVKGNADEAGEAQKLQEDADVPIENLEAAQDKPVNAEEGVSTADTMNDVDATNGAAATDDVQVEPAAESEEPTSDEPQPTAYTICPGDTLIGISMRKYGTDAQVAEICNINRIVDPNDIKVGEKILLP
ncbi:MAG: LysM peptidoglycan-binding domain-containing protein [Lachnospiraceae bacterium]|nr:LysM peptidoglycan-binding domain-containing protein [Lachnospiraceae bacterium]